MGEIAEMMLDGTMCECCGEYIDEEGFGCPRYCSPECAKDRGAEYIDTGKDATEMDTILVGIQNAQTFLEMASESLFALGKKKKAKSLRGLVKQIDLFAGSIQ